MDPSRRKFLKAAGAAGTVAIGPSASARAMTAEEEVSLNAKRRGVLVDATKCIGCRACEAACAETNGLPGREETDGPAAFARRRRMDTRTYTIVNSSKVFGASTRERFMKRQCMHCLEPACASACLARALDKTPTGPVVYYKARCLGCRYCMVACPFSIPKYEYESPLPYVKKCTFCADRQAKGESPACTSVCPSGALQFGLRDELIDIAHERIYASGSTYVRHIYGEHEVGGTSWMYITDIPFENLGLPADVGTYAYSSLTQASLAAVPFVLTLWPPLLMGLYTFSKRRDEVAASDAHRLEAHHE
jgi:Fe-S-cluster-containing dehydrogenase component